jgi:hypothetical protein
MRVRRWSAIVWSTAICAAGTVSSNTWQEPPQFRGSTAAVAVHVIVRERRTPIHGLRAFEFVLTDSGVPQEITAVDATRVPIDLSLIVEQTDNREYWRQGYQREIADVVRLLDDDDRIRVVSVGADVWQIVPLSAREAVGAVRPPVMTSFAALHDALASVLMRRSDSTRQHVVLVLGSLFDSLSVVNADALVEIARRSDARVHVLVPNAGTLGTRAVARRHVAVSSNANWSDEGRRARLLAIGEMTRRRAASSEQESPTALAVQDAAFRDFIRIAEESGGAQLGQGVFTGSITGPVRHVLEQVRAGYVLYYSPTGVPLKGWHPIEVKVTRQGPWEVVARRGYSR